MRFAIILFALFVAAVAEEPSSTPKVTKTSKKFHGIIHKNKKEEVADPKVAAAAAPSTTTVKSTDLDPVADSSHNKTEIERKKKSTTTFCVEIKPTDPHHNPFQICEPPPFKPVYAVPLPVQPTGYYSAPSYGAPLHHPPPLKPAYGAPIPYEEPKPVPAPAYSAPAVSYSAPKPQEHIEHAAKAAATAAAKSTSYPASQPAHSSYSAPASQPAYSAPHKSYSVPAPRPASYSRGEAGYSAPGSRDQSYRSKDTSHEAADSEAHHDLVRMASDEEGAEESAELAVVRSAGYGDEYGSPYGGNIAPVSYITSIVKPSKKDKFIGKKGHGHSGVVITCNPALAGYASGIPNYGGSAAAYRNAYSSSYPSRGYGTTFKKPVKAGGYGAPTRTFKSYGGYEAPRAQPTYGGAKSEPLFEASRAQPSYGKKLVPVYGEAPRGYGASRIEPLPTFEAPRALPQAYGGSKSSYGHSRAEPLLPMEEPRGYGASRLEPLPMEEPRALPQPGYGEVKVAPPSYGAPKVLPQPAYGASRAEPLPTIEQPRDLPQPAYGASKSGYGASRIEPVFEQPRALPQPAYGESKGAPAYGASKSGYGAAKLEPMIEQPRVLPQPAYGASRSEPLPQLEEQRALPQQFAESKAGPSAYGGSRAEPLPAMEEPRALPQPASYGSKYNPPAYGASGGYRQAEDKTPEEKEKHTIEKMKEVSTARSSTGEPEKKSEVEMKKSDGERVSMMEMRKSSQADGDMDHRSWGKGSGSIESGADASGPRRFNMDILQNQETVGEEEAKLGQEMGHSELGGKWRTNEENPSSEATLQAAGAWNAFGAEKNDNMNMLDSTMK